MRTGIARATHWGLLGLLTLAVFAAVRVEAAQEPSHEAASKKETQRRALAAEAGEFTGGERPVAGHPGEKHETGVPLAPKADLAFWSGVTFVIFVLVLARFAWKPLIAALDLREGKVRGDIAAAEQARLKAEQMLAEHSRKMAQVQDEIRELLAEARRDADHAKSEIITQAQKEAESAKQRAVQEIGRARDSALKDLFDVMATEVAHATQHVLGRSVNAADQDRLIDEALAQFPRRS
jgi:F-type H+-transporting ATPase subunit b